MHYKPATLFRADVHVWEIAHGLVFATCTIYTLSNFTQFSLAVVGMGLKLAVYM